MATGTALFYVMSAILIFFSLKVVTTKNLFHSVLSAFAVLLSTAALFFLLNAEFLGMAQILVYAGAVTVLVIFVVMLTTAGDEYKISWEQTRNPLAFFFVVLFGGMLAFVVLTIEWPTVTPPEPVADVTRVLASTLFTDYILPFEIASIVLLTALIGAIVLARRD